MNRYDAVIFDLDGTLLDTLEDLKNAINHALEGEGFARRTLDEVRRFVGCGALELCRRATPAGTSDEQIRAVLAGFHAYYSQHSNDCTAPYPGIMELLKDLQEAGVKVAVVSNKPDPQVRSLCRDYFGISLAAGDREGVRRKPAPDAVWAVMETLGATRERTLYVGDSDVDVQTALNAHVDCAAVLWGFRSREELAQAGAKTFASTADELLSLIVNA